MGSTYGGAGTIWEAEHEQIRATCLSVPLVDAHAHNVVPLDSNLPFLQCLSDERGHEALSAVPLSLAYQRSLQELGYLYGVEPDVNAIKEHRNAIGLEAVSEKCFSGANIEIVLLDDGLTMDKMLGMGWHRKYIPGVHRVLRIETVAEAVLNQPVGQGGLATWTLESFDHRFVSTLESLSEKVVAFKSICAYRSGLRINPLVSAQAAENGLQENLRNHEAGQPVRVSNKEFIDFMFVRALEVATQRNIPMQIHTGFGDKDLQLELANPLHLRAILEDPLFIKSRIVLLHGSYPFMREASYLASVYPQVHIDFGLVVPMLSVRGMRCAVSDLLDLAPVNKIMYSSDGYAFPETFYLGAKWSRDILSRVLCESYDNGDLTLEEAIAAGELILGRNALEFYKLEGIKPPRSFSVLSRSHSTESLTRLQESIIPPTQVERPPSFEFKVTGPVPNPPQTPKPGPESGTVSSKDYIGPEAVPAPVPVEVNAQELVVMKSIELKRVRLMFTDVSGQRRCRVVPIQRFEEVVVEYGVGLSKCIMAMPSCIDAPVPKSGLTCTGEIRLMPDLSTKVRVPWCQEDAFVSVDMHEKPGIPWNYCPRTTLRRLSQALFVEYKLVMRAGFEIGFYLLKRNGSKSWEGLGETPYSSSAGIHAVSGILSEIFDSLAYLNIHVDEMHCEGGGQIVLAIGDTHCLSAADNLTLVKETVFAIASKHSLHATFAPKLSVSSAVGNSRLRLSLWQKDTNALIIKDGSQGKYGLSDVGQEFMGGIFHHLPAIHAFTAPLPHSYDTPQLSGEGKHQFWGVENLQAPLRTNRSWSSLLEGVSSLELTPFDGSANPYLGLAAILAAGIDGLRKHIHAPEPMDDDVVELDKETVRRLPGSLEEAIAALESDSVLCESLGAPLMVAVSAVRKADIEFYKGRQDMAELLSRY